jgi:hypothetical protein
MKIEIFCKEKLQEIFPPQSKEEELDKEINQKRKYLSVGELKCRLVNSEF